MVFIFCGFDEVHRVKKNWSGSQSFQQEECYLRFLSWLQECEQVLHCWFLHPGQLLRQFFQFVKDFRHFDECSLQLFY
ncbi:hypothetical protein CSA56_10540 [candidate division KSB3 bacterium]|uniref:Uncharacterized protein n=1 Tax=candidate division KSB3 bacterium TaxID=2044937 RepID=A0A2G6KDK0_9BACT|nr:MAG: hypothetical protein CSA56_10540 [candidate division KSB3 bacterium]